MNIHSFVPRGDGAFRGWLLTIAKNNLRDAIKSLEAEKRGGRRKRVGVWENGYAELYELVVGSSTPGRKVARAEAAQLLQQALDELPEHYRRVIQMYDVDGLAMGDVATAIGKSEGAAFMVRQRALRVLHRLLIDPMADYSSFS